MQLLFSLHLPLLPLQALRPCWSEPGPFAVIDGGRVLAVSAEAAALGVRPGLRAGGAQAIAPQAVLLERDLQKEADALQAAILALFQFTPDIAHAPDFGLLLDVGPSLRLFHGPRALADKVLHCLSQQGLSATLGAAPTAAGAWLLARRPRQRQRPLRRRCLRLATLATLLDSLPCSILPEAQPFLPLLTGIGARDLAALRRLPKSGLLRRTSVQLADALAGAYGESIELFRWISIPATFTARLDTLERIERADDLLEGASRLLLQMTGWLTVRQLAAAAFTLLLLHERGRAAIAPTALEMVLAEPAWQDAHLLRLLKERLARIELPAPVIGLQLDAVRLEAQAPPSGELFPQPGGSPADLLRLLELLSARLGADNVLMPQLTPDHRPEVCNTWGPAAVKPRRSTIDAEELDRPFWLLEKPVKLLLRDERPYYGSPLALIRGPERIEAGWWNNQTAARDYYVAQGADAACYWIYRERGGDMHWYLHGLYG
ncbi:Y-family DNA polymerase [Massilia sp. SM-13]|uniref:Y-family DNA polymerase n=1 Tax=Pseudoduganella rhizocola TaxID=3382643 RepID=UPI0038B67778